jgi:hypothetical protein
MNSPAQIIERVYLQFSSDSGEGLQMEICKATARGDLNALDPKPVAWITADHNEKLWLEFGVGAGKMRLPLTEIERALEIAKSEVHSEAWYQKR